MTVYGPIAKTCPQHPTFPLHWIHPLRAYAPSVLARGRWSTGETAPSKVICSSAFSLAQTSTLNPAASHSLKSVSHPVPGTPSHPTGVKRNRNLHSALCHSPLYGQGEGMPFAIECSWFIYLSEMKPCCLESSPLRDNSRGSPWRHLLPWWCAYCFCWRVSTSISPFLLSARWKCLQVLQS